MANADINKALKAARQHMLTVATELGHLAPSNGQILRDYTVRYMVVEEVDNEGADCEYCAEIYDDGDTGVVTHQVYAVPFASYECQTTWGTCVRCALGSVDQVEDIDPSFTVLIEKTSNVQ